MNENPKANEIPGTGIGSRGRPEPAEGYDERRRDADVRELFEAQQEFWELLEELQDAASSELSQQTQIIQGLQDRIVRPQDMRSQRVSSPTLAEMRALLEQQRLRLQPSSLDPKIRYSPEDLKVQLDFPGSKDIHSLSVQLEPNTRNVIAELLTSQEAARILQGQLDDLRRNLAKHDLHLKQVRINPSSGGNERDGRRHRHHRDSQEQQER